MYVDRTTISAYLNETINRVGDNDDPDAPTALQTQHVRMAAQHREFLASVNHGAPGHAAFATPLTREHEGPAFAPARPIQRGRSSYTNSFPGSANRRGVAASSAFARFDRPAQPGTARPLRASVNAHATYRSPNARAHRGAAHSYRPSHGAARPAQHVHPGARPTMRKAR